MFNDPKLSEQANKQLQELESRYVGKRVLIVKPGHPFEGSKGTVKELEYAPGVGYGFIVEYPDFEQSGYVFNQSEWQVLN